LVQFDTRKRQLTTLKQRWCT